MCLYFHFMLQFMNCICIAYWNTILGLTLVYYNMCPSMNICCYKFLDNTSLFPPPSEYKVPRWPHLLLGQERGCSFPSIYGTNNSSSYLIYKDRYWHKYSYWWRLLSCCILVIWLLCSTLQGQLTLKNALPRCRPQEVLYTQVPAARTTLFTH